MYFSKTVFQYTVYSLKLFCHVKFWLFFLFALFFFFLLKKSFYYFSFWTKHISKQTQHLLSPEEIPEQGW